MENTGNTSALPPLSVPYAVIRYLQRKPKKKRRAKEDGGGGEEGNEKMGEREREREKKIKEERG
jgi:hypothetical protein